MPLTIKFYDVEHGSCTHIITPNGKHILVDIGSKTDKSIVRYLKNKFSFYSGTIDQLIITHPHEDHIWDIPNMYKLGLKPLVVQRPTGAFDIIPQLNTQPHIDIANYANTMNREYCSPVLWENDPVNAMVNGGVEIEIITAPSSKQIKDDLNTFSSIVVLKYSNFKFVLTGDNPPNILKYMIENNIDGINSKIADATVLLAPHHGRTADFCKDFFDKVNPRLSVISDKEIVYATQEDSSYVYRGRGVKWGDKTRYVFSTRNDGTITFALKLDSWSIDTSTTEY